MGSAAIVLSALSAFQKRLRRLEISLRDADNDAEFLTALAGTEAGLNNLALTIGSERCAAVMRQRSRKEI